MYFYGIVPAATGMISYNKTPTQIKELGVRLSFVPEDRLGMGLVGNMDIIDNMMLRSYKKGNSAFLDRKNPKKLAEKIIESLEVVTPGATTPVRRLSGGNVQKVLVGREIAANPKVLMAAYPVRGLDINSRALVRNPAVILADEPTGALDSHTGREVIGMLQQLHREGHTVVLITHDNSIAVQAERIYRG